MSASTATADAATENRPDRKAAILLAAERLFAEHGYHAVTVRQIAADADVPLALVGYYYGAKHELFHAIFEHWAPTIQQRLARLREAMAESPRPSLERIVRAFVEPVIALRASPEGEYYAQLVARELVFRMPEMDRVLADYFDPLAEAFIDALVLASPGSERGRAALAYQFALGALLHHLSDRRIERLSHGARRAGDPAALGPLVTFMTAGLVALLPLAAH